jgi:GNAT superfamily N-acetyltransferase
MSEFNIQYIFCNVDSTLQTSIKSFWKENITTYCQEMDTYSPNNKDLKTYSTYRASVARKPAAIAHDRSGKIIGIVFVALRPINQELNLGRCAYFQRMYIIKNYRGAKLAYRLHQTFLEGFIAAKGPRDHRAKHLMLIIGHPRLQNTFIRKYLDRSGFRLLGSNTIKEEIWHLPLETIYNL